MHNFFDLLPDPEILRADLPPGVVLWWVRGKVLHTEIVERPIYTTSSPVLGGAGGMSGLSKPDTIIALHDRDDPLKGYEIRLHGRVDAIAPGDKLELLGHTTPHQQAFIPRMAFSIKKNWWWPCLPALRSGQKGFIIEFHTDWKEKSTSSYDKELDGWFIVQAPAPVPAAVPAAAPPRSAFGLLLGAAKQIAAAAAPLAAAWMKVDLLPVYKQLIPDLADDDPETAQSHFADDSDDLPPL